MKKISQVYKVLVLQYPNSLHAYNTMYFTYSKSNYLHTFYIHGETTMPFPSFSAVMLLMLVQATTAALVGTLFTSVLANMLLKSGSVTVC